MDKNELELESKINKQIIIDSVISKLIQTESSINKNLELSSIVSTVLYISSYLPLEEEEE